MCIISGVGGVGGGGNFLLWCQLSVLILILYPISGGIFFSLGSAFCALILYSFCPCATAVARKRSQSFCQKCKWQVTCPA